MYVSHIIAPHSRWDRYLGMTAAMTHTHRGTYNGSPSVCALTTGMRHSKYFLMSNRTFLAQRINREVLSQAKRHKCRILWLGKKINAIYFVLLSTFRNSGFAEVLGTRK